jgi:CDP-glycerol glycerophosphotransferase (TagB/SpsB family)
MKFFVFLFGFFLYPISFVIPRSKKKLAFGSFKNAFNDNSKYLFIYASEHKSDLDIAWLSASRGTVKRLRELGLKAYFVGSFKGLWFAFRSKYWFFNAYTSDILFFASGGAICVNLWHGVGLKKIEFSIKDGPLSDRFVKKTLKERYFHPESYRRPNYLLSSTDFQSVKLAEAFRINKSQCLNLSYPRNQILIENEEKRKIFIKKYEPQVTSEFLNKISLFRKVYIYMPTWRDSQADIFSHSIDLKRLDNLMKEKNDVLILKPHANTIVDREKLSQYNNILLLDKLIDTYTILPYTDVLITDYSSVLYDYILMENKDVILYLYDIEEYINTRDFNYPFHENVVGAEVFTFDELLSCMEKENYSIDNEKRSELCLKFWGADHKLNVYDEIFEATIYSH